MKARYMPVIAAAATMMLGAAADAAKYQNFVDFKRRTTDGDTIIRSFPNAGTPSFRLILERNPFQCILWLEFLPRGLPIDHWERQFGPAINDPSPRGPDFRELAEAPLDGQENFDEHDREGLLASERDDLHWVARGTNDALDLLHLHVHREEASGACLAGTNVRYTSNLTYRDVVDGAPFTGAGQHRVRGFPGKDPTFTVWAEILPAGTSISLGGNDPITLIESACVLSLQFGDTFDQFWIPNVEPILDTYTVGDRIFVLSSRFPNDDLASEQIVLSQKRVYRHNGTGETFAIVDAFISFDQTTLTCHPRVRTQYAPTIQDFYR